MALILKVSELGIFTIPGRFVTIIHLVVIFQLSLMVLLLASLLVSIMSSFKFALGILFMST